jgi:hypothetical protein
MDPDRRADDVSKPSAARLHWTFEEQGGLRGD